MRFEFDDYALDTDRRELTRGSRLVQVSPKVFDLLLYLIENRERVVSKDDLVEAVWDGRIVSDSTVTSHMNAARKAVGDTGGERNLIRTLARKGFRFVGEVTTRSPSADAVPTDDAPAPSAATPDAQPPLPDKPSIAVLAFENLSGDPEQEYFADGLADEIITGLSKFHWFFVIARNSSFTYKGKAVEVKQVARELGVQYVLEGSVRRAGNRVRIIAQLVDALTGRHVWAERYDRHLEDVFEVQDEVTEAIVTAVAPSFITAEARRVERKPPESFDAWDCVLRGNWFLFHWNREDIAEAKRLFENALEIDPRSTAAPTGLAFALVLEITFGWADDVDAARAAALAIGRRAVAQDPTDAEAHLALARAWHIVRQLDAAAAACRSALELNPNLASAETLLAQVLSWRGDRGDYDEALLHVEKADRLSPHDPVPWRNVPRMSIAFATGDYEAAVAWAKKTIEVMPESPAAWRYLAASSAHLGRMEEARAAKEQLVRLMPHENLQFIRAIFSGVNLDRLERFVDGLRKAGVPE